MEPEHDARDVGWSDAPPQGAKGRETPRYEQSAYPPADRPVYSVPPEEDKKGGGFSGGFNFTVLFVVAIILLAMAGLYLYQPAFIKDGLKASAPAPAAEEAQPAVPADNLPRSEVLRAELARTISILQQMENRPGGSEEERKKIMDLKKEARDLLDSLDG